MVVEQRGRVTQLNQSVNQRWEELMEKAKPFQISKRIVFEAYQQVKANKGVAGVDRQSIQAFEQDLKDNL